MPLLTPEMADKMARPTAMTIKRIMWEKDGVEKMPTALRPALSCMAPKPSVVVRPKIVAQRATISIKLPQKPFNLFLRRGIKTGTQGYGKLISESKIGQGKTDDTINSPGMDTPVKKSVQHGFFRLYQGRG